MTSSWVKLLLVVSLVFNVLFVAGYARSMSSMSDRHQRFERRAQWFAKQLDLDDQQQTAFDALVAETIEKRREIHKKNLPHMEQMLDELVKDEPDTKVLLETPSFDRHKTRHDLKIQQMTKLMSILRPDQRHKFAELIRAKMRKKAEH